MIFRGKCQKREGHMNTYNDASYRSVNAAFNWVNELKSDKYTPTAVLYQQRITAIAAIELAQDRQVVDACQVCVRLSCFSCGLSFPYSRPLLPRPSVPYRRILFSPAFA